MNDTIKKLIKEAGGETSEEREKYEVELTQAFMKHMDDFIRRNNVQAHLVEYVSAWYMGQAMGQQGVNYLSKRQLDVIATAMRFGMIEAVIQETKKK